MFFAQADQTNATEAVTTANLADHYPDLVAGITADVSHFIPELILCVGIVWVIMIDLFGNGDRKKVGYHALGVLALTFVALVIQGFPNEEESKSLFHGMIVHDGFGTFFKFLTVIGTAICIPMFMMHKKLNRDRMGEFYGLLLGAVLGMFIMATAKNMLMFFMGIEFASFTSYLLAGYIKDDRKAAEGGVKYVIYGSVASGIMVYGMSMIYGLTGSLDIAAVTDVLLVQKTSSLTLVVTALLTFAGFAYKISAFPMHFWAPDVYEGSPMPFTAFLSVISKAAGFAVLIRLVAGFAANEGYTLNPLEGEGIAMDWPNILGVVAVLTMCVGNFSALWQTNIKRLLAYSSIAHAGYLLMGVAALAPMTAGGSPGWEPVLFYMVVYLFMNLGGFLIAGIVSNNADDESVEAFRGLGKRSPMLAVGFFVCLISLIGLPPTGGFSGKWQLLRVAWEGGLHYVVYFAVFNTVISVWYYARIIKLMFLDEGEDSRVVMSKPLSTFVVLMIVPILYLGLFFDSAVNFIRGLTITGI
ncbi:MAG: NADH-quinone oxidoreductase subunit N [Planctomycetota bacterium]|jgi:NADH-quinone oxidoreductase subunit N